MAAGGLRERTTPISRALIERERSFLERVGQRDAFDVLHDDEVDTDIELPPFPEYLRIGIPVALATDDRGMWSSNMTDEYFLAVTSYNLSWDELVAAGRTSLEFAFLPEPENATLLEEYERDVAAFEAEFGGNDWRERARDVPAKISGYAHRHLLR